MQHTPVPPHGSGSHGDQDYVLNPFSQQARPFPYDSWASSMPSYLLPLTEATLNGQAYSNTHNSTLPSRIRAIEEEIYGYTPTHHADQALGRYAPENNTRTTNTEHKRKRANYGASSDGSQETEMPSQQHKRPTLETAQTEDTRVTSGSGGSADDDDGEVGDDSNIAGKDTYKAVRSRESSRRYRQRKKECFESMKRQVERYEDERRQWAKESDAAHKVIEQLTQENEDLKDKHRSDAVRVCLPSFICVVGICRPLLYEFFSSSVVMIVCMMRGITRFARNGLHSFHS
eukprot:TRINITY_DN1666_c0_g1_i2.p1 TRINITY_DN1666_c0_g1~~TRINITY_DN1666_c0_g1_i2.p1  ORF type:complete len:288 (-),score=36.72 TRINITY_DN1666_c0_g1_i2:656-1519(-)